MIDQVSAKPQVRRSGFTIVELVVVVAVIGILAAITITSYTGISQRAVASSLQSDLGNASKQIKMDQVINGAYPTSLAAANSGRGISASSGTIYQYYAVNNSSNPQTFCITAINGSQSYKITNDVAPTAGDCQSYGLVMNLDAGNSASYPGSGTTWTDLSVSNNNGVLQNSPTYTSSGGGALVFNGTNAYVSQAAYNPTISFATDFSIEATVKITAYQPGTFYGIANQIIARGSAATYNYALHISNATTIQFVKRTSPEVLLFTSFTVPSLTNNVADIVITYQNSTLSLYLNGAIIGTASVTNIQPGPSNNDPLYIGGAGGQTYTNFTGNIYFVKLYNRALSSTDVQQNFNLVRGRFGL